MKSALSNPKHLNVVPTIAGSNRDEVKLWLASAEYFVKLEESFPWQYDKYSKAGS